MLNHVRVGLTATLATFVLGLFPEDKDLTDTNEILKWAFLIFPNYCLGRGYATKCFERSFLLE